MAALGLAGLVVIIVAAMALLRGGDDPDAQPVEELAESTVPAISTAAEERRRREIELIERAGNLAESGDPAAALDLLRQELSDDPLSVRLPRVYLELAARLEAEAPNIFEVFVEERMLAAQDQIEAQEYEKAGELLERVLFVDPEHAAAKERLEDIEALLKRPSTPSRRPRRAAPPPPPPPEEVTEVALPLPSPPPPPGDLRIVLRTSIAQGTVKVETNEAVLLSESFDYPGRRLIKQKYLKKVQGFEKTVSLASGPVDLRIQIEVDTKDGLKRPSGGLRKTIVPERVHLLTITVDDDASLDLRFE